MSLFYYIIGTGDNMKILIVEDDKYINELLSIIVEQNGFETVGAFSGTEGKLLFELEQPDLVLLDLMLPGITGEEFIREIRMISDVPIIVITATEGKESMIHILNAGADDYLKKPFDRDELLARIGSVLRRNRTAVNVPEELFILEYENLSINLESRVVELCGEELELTKIEYEIIKLLMENSKKVFTKRNLIDSVWQDVYTDENTLNVHISNLRNKLSKLDPDTEYIKTVWGIGYKLGV